MNERTFANDLMSRMLPLEDLRVLSSSTGYLQGLGQELLDPNRAREAFLFAAREDNPDILERLIAVHGYPNGLDVSIEGYDDENAPMQGEELIGEALKNGSTRVFKYLRGRFGNLESLDFDTLTSFALMNLYDNLLNGEIDLDTLYFAFDTLLKANKDLRWQVE